MKNFKGFKRYRFDTNSLKFKLWAYFALFAILLMLLLWSMQILFLKNFYEEMKTRDIIRIANSLSTEGFSLDENKIREVSFTNNMLIHIEDELNISEAITEGHPGMERYTRELLEVTAMLRNSDEKQIITKVNPPDAKGAVLVYGKKISITYPPITALGLTTPAITTNGYLSIACPLSPMESTLDILTDWLVVVTAISLFLAFCISFFISKRITRPLIKITNSAVKLAEGKYGVTFEGGHYSEIVRLADTLTYTSKELAKSDNLQKDLIANVSHDLRTPLTMVKSYAEMIRDISGENPEKRNAHLEVIIEEADRLNRLVNDLLVLSKMQSGVTALETGEFDFKDTAQVMFNSYCLYIEQEDYQLDFQCTMDTIPIKGDEQKLKQVLSNLLNNALRYSGETKRISMQLSEKPGYVRCEIIDSGPGIAEEDLKFIWDRYYRASSNLGRSASGGSGLGLAIVKEILTLHNAKFGVESQLGVGSTFWFELPLNKTI